MTHYYLRILLVFNFLWQQLRVTRFQFLVWSFLDLSSLIPVYIALCPTIRFNIVPPEASCLWGKTVHPGYSLTTCLPDLRKTSHSVAVGRTQPVSSSQRRFKASTSRSWSNLFPPGSLLQVQSFILLTPSFILHPVDSTLHPPGFILHHPSSWLYPFFNPLPLLVPFSFVIALCTLIAFRSMARSRNAFIIVIIYTFSTCHKPSGGLPASLTNSLTADDDERVFLQQPPTPTATLSYLICQTNVTGWSRIHRTCWGPTIFCGSRD